jgi:betaine-aldehyde dehydrogenase
MADQTFRNFVNGESVEAASGETYDVLDPSTGEVYARAPLSGAEDVDRAYAAAEEAFASRWGSTTPRERSEALLKIADAL